MDKVLSDPPPPSTTAAPPFTDAAGDDRGKAILVTNPVVDGSVPSSEVEPGWKQAKSKKKKATTAKEAASFKLAPPKDGDQSRKLKDAAPKALKLRDGHSAPASSAV